MSLHPVIRILSFLIIVVFLARLALPGMLILTSVFIFFAAFSAHQTISVVSQFAWRLRWFWLAILLLYSLMSHHGGETTSILSVSLSGFQEGSIRCLSLLIVIFYFVLLIHPLRPNQLQQAWSWLMRPLGIIRINPDVFSLRLALTFHAVREMQTMQIKPEHKLKMRQLPEQLFAYLQLAIEKSRVHEDTTDSIPAASSSPEHVQWLVPAAIVLILTFLLVWQR